MENKKRIAEIEHEIEQINYAIACAKEQKIKLYLERQRLLAGTATSEEQREQERKVVA